MAFDLILISALLCCCTPKEETPSTENNGKDVDMELNITADSSFGEWKEGDELSIIDNTGDHKFSAASSGRTALFKGQGYARALGRIAVYPYLEGLAIDGDSFTVTIPERQQEMQKYSIASSNTKTLKMKALNAGICFSVNSSDILSVDIEGCGAETLCGKAVWNISNKDYSISCDSYGDKSKITLTPKDGETFVRAGEHSVSCYPAKAEKGLIFTLHYKDVSTRFTYEKACQLVAGQSLQAGDIESGAKAVEDESAAFDITKPQFPSSNEPLDLELVFISSASGTNFQWPFVSPKATDIASSWGEGKSSFPCQETRLVLPESKGGYSFQVFASIGLTKNGSASQGLKLGGAVEDYLAFPAIKGLYLTEITWVGGGCTVEKSRIAKTSDGATVKGGEAIYQESLGKGETYTWTLYGSEKETSYKLCAGGADALHFQKIILHYDTVVPEDPSLQFQEVGKDQIPDFSRVGYHWGEKEIPDVPVVMTISAPADNSDALELIQKAIDTAPSPGAVLLKAGTYYVSNTIKMKRSGIVLRGEGEDKTIIKCTSTEDGNGSNKVSALIYLGSSASKVLGDNSKIIAKYVPVGQMWVPVANPEKFAVGDDVYIYRPATPAWIHDLHMDELAELYPGNVNWDPAAYGIYWQRKVMSIDGYKIYLDNPVVMCLGGEEKYGTARLYKGKVARISECGVENLSLDTVYDPSVMTGNDYTDENHCVSAINVTNTEHSWIRNVTTRHFYLSGVDLKSGAKNITVSDCTVLEPVAKVEGGRRYAFHFSASEQCLIKNCLCDDDRHQYVCGGRVPGPNVFLRCRGTHSRSDAGPHQRWATGVLYDNIKVTRDINVQDRAGWGTGHGWAGVNFVFYNCEATSYVVQSPWVTGQNWCIGCIGTKKSTTYSNFKDNYGPRPDGIWESQGSHVSPESLYESQLADRLSKGILIDK
ncbi:MAG: glycosyl hydrolase family 28-related protein [Bacteroidales bacterium]|nr:glycosyl hydrolase family 28-related protein [Bacteroidales bacterium]